MDEEAEVSCQHNQIHNCARPWSLVRHGAVAQWSVLLQSRWLSWFPIVLETLGLLIGADISV